MRMIPREIAGGLLSALIIFGSYYYAEGNRMLDAARRQIRALSYPEESELGLFFALAIPLDDPVSTKAISVAFFFEANYKLVNENVEKNETEMRTKRNSRKIDRKTVYAALESKFDEFGYPGKQCLLRSICETSRGQDQLHENNGLIGDLIRITFTPSSSLDEGLPMEYSAAENNDDFIGDCGSIYNECPISIYQHITTSF